jgi:hypothetical protein
MLLFLVGGLVAGGNEERVKHSANYYGLNDTGVCVCAQAPAGSIAVAEYM